MSVINKTVPVSQEADEFMTKLNDFISVVKTQLADGWQAGTDLPPMMTAALMDLVPAIQAATKFGDAFTADKIAFIKGMELGATDLAFTLL